MIGKNIKRHRVSKVNTHLGTWKVGTYECILAASFSRLLVVKQTSDQAQSLPSLDRDGSVALVRPLLSRALTPGTPKRKAAFTVMYCTAQCAVAREGGEVRA